MNLPRAIFWAGALPMALGAAFLVEWLVPGFRPGWLGGPDLALAFVLCGSALLLLTRGTGPARRAALALAGALALLVLLRLALSAGGGWSVLPGSDAGTVVRNRDFVLTDPASIAAAGQLAFAVALALLACPGRIREGPAIAALLAVAGSVTGLAGAGGLALDPSPDTAAWPAALAVAGLGASIATGLYRLARATPAGRAPSYPDTEYTVAAALGATLGLAALGGLLGYHLVARSVADARRVEADHGYVVAFDRLDSALVLAESGARAFVATDGHASLEPYRRALAELDPPLRVVARLATAPWSSPAAAGLAPAIQSELVQLQASIDAQRAGRHDEAARALARLDAAGLTGRIAADIATIAQAARDDLARQAARREAERQRTLLAFAAGALLVGLLVILLHRRFARDLADRRRIDAALRRHNETLQSFAHTVAHDLRAPLRGIAGYTGELAAQSAALDERGRFCIAQIDSAARHLERLIDGTLAYTRVDAAQPALAAIDLPALVAGLLRQRAPQIRDHRTEIATHFAAPTIVSWEQGLAQVLGNLLDNAIKYSRGGRPPRVRIESSDTPTAWRLTVQDNGIGFDPQHRERIFGLFQRLPNSREFEGTGAGLAIVRKILDRLGGTVRAESRPGGGATFIVELPKSPAGALA